APLHRAGTPRQVGGVLHAGDLEVGGLYVRAGMYYAPRPDLTGPQGPPLSEPPLEHDLVNRALDGVAGSLVTTVRSAWDLVRHPIRTLAQLRELPGAIGALIESAPQVWERFRNLSPGDQTEAVARLLTDLY